jgi:DNA-binding CsgD family transcriptional regulator/tetratricopeptide (TPR) repeat protein
LTEQNARVVAQICHRLDGMPLALELAAARVKSMGIDEIAARLDDRFRLLTSAGRKVVPRQQTLRATMDWSYDLLSEQERVLLRRLSVFAGGWTLSAAEAICANSYLDSHAILDVQSQLIDKSLVVMDEPSGHARYHFLETVRQYAREKLVEAGEEELVCLHHLDYFLKLAEEAEPNLRATDQVDWMNRLELERDNLRTALSLTITYEHYLELGLRMAGSLWEFWSVRGYGREGNTWLQDLITRNETSQTSNMAKALYGAGALARDDGNNKIARMYFEKSLIIYRELNDRRGIAHVLGNLGLLNLRQGAYLTAKKRYGESLALFRELADQRGIADSLAGFGAIARSEGELMLARTFSEQALNIRRAIVDKAGMTFSLSALGGIASLLGDYPTATVYYEEALTIRHELGDMSIASYVPLLSLGYLALANNNLAVAQDYFSKSLALARRQTNEWRTMTSLSRLGYLALLKGNHDVAQSLFQKTLELARALGSKRYVSLALQYIGFLSAGRGDLQNATTCLADSLTVLWEDENQEFTAEFVVSCCETALVLSRAECVAQLLGVLEMLLKSTPMPHDPLYRIRHDRVVTTVRTQLDEATFNAAWAEGQAMTLEQAIAEALQVSAQHPVAQESKTSAEPRQYPGGLTRREVEVLRLLAVGLSNQEIADKLVLSKRTVHAHLRSIFAKLDVTTRTAATRVALEHKIV